MDMQEIQIHSKEQEIVLQTLATSVAKPKCLFLEVGSWCGHSATILGRIAKEHDGLLFCVDWWRGNPDTELADIAERADVFSFFWHRICENDLQDHVIPIRAKSHLLHGILKENTFDLVFIDADHIYHSIKKDIEVYKPFVKKEGGVLCGHDCPGYFSDYELDFLQQGKDQNVFQSVHCGVVVAVGENFDNYSVNHNFWSVRRDGDLGWHPTNLQFPGIQDKKQTSLPPIRISKQYIYYRYGRDIFIVPSKLSHLDLSSEENRRHRDVIVAKTLEEAEKITKEKIFVLPEYLDKYKNFRLLHFKDKFYALSDVVHIDWVDWLNESKFKDLVDEGFCMVSDTSSSLMEKIDKHEALLSACCRT